MIQYLLKDVDCRCLHFRITNISKFMSSFQINFDILFTIFELFPWILNYIRSWYVSSFSMIYLPPPTLNIICFFDLFWILLGIRFLKLFKFWHLNCDIYEIINTGSFIKKILMLKLKCFVKKLYISENSRVKPCWFLRRKNILFIPFFMKFELIFKRYKSLLRAVYVLRHILKG